MRLYFLLVFVFVFGSIKAQNISTSTIYGMDNKIPKTYKIGQIKVEGAITEPLAVVVRSGLAQGDNIKIPGEQLGNAIKKLWDTGLFTDVQILIDEVRGDQLFLVIKVEQTPKINEFVFIGIKKSEKKELKELLASFVGARVSNNTDFTIKKIVQNYFEDKSRSTTKIELFTTPDTLDRNAVKMNVQIDKGPKIRVKIIEFENNYALPDSRIRKSLKETKQRGIKNVFFGGKYNAKTFQNEKLNIEKEYRNNGFKDARLVSDSVYFVNEKRVGIRLKVEEGNRYYYRNIEFDGNTKYTDEQLKRILGIAPGDIYKEEQLMRKLMMDPQGGDVSSLYLDDGYLFFNVQTEEKTVRNDSVDLVIKIFEGKQARIGKIIVNGNTKTSDHVIIRELYTKPGELFKRSDIIRSQNELNNLKYFSPEKMQVIPKPNPTDGTVDIEYIVQEQPSDQFELQGGYGAGFVVGTLGLNFTNFSSRKLFKPGGWQPIPSGDGQTLSLRAQSSGRFFQSYNFTFVEPWAGGKRPQALSFSVFHTRLRSFRTDGYQNITGASIGLGNRLKWPDNYFRSNISFGYQLYDVNNFTGLSKLKPGQYNNLNIKLSLSRSSIDQPIYPRSGVEMTMTAQFTAPVVSLNNTREQLEIIGKSGDFTWIEYHKYKFHLGWYNNLIEKLVLYTKVNFGVMSSYSAALGVSPFERFYMGGSGLMGFNIDGREIIPLRGYQEAQQTNVVYDGDGVNGGIAAVKYTMELRYPISLQPSATVFALTFFEAGNTFSALRNYDPFNVRRTVGAGVRLFLPMIGMLGFDYGFPFNPANQNVSPELFKSFPGQFTFTFGGNLSGW